METYCTCCVFKECAYASKRQGTERFGEVVCRMHLMHEIIVPFKNIYLFGQIITSLGTHKKCIFDASDFYGSYSIV